MANIDNFTKLMNACLESKKTPSKKSLKVESKEIKRLNEKVNTRRFKKEADEKDDDEDVEKDDLEMETSDDIIAVVDPDLDADEMTAVALGFQQLIDDAPEDVTPTTDEYVGDNIYGCPICGQTFFSEIPMGAGDICLMCNQESPDGFVKVGEVENSENPDEDVAKNDDEGEEKKVDGEEDFDFDGEEVKVDFDEDEKDLEESKKTVKDENRARRPVTRTVRGENKKKACDEGDDCVDEECGKKKVRKERTISRRPATRTVRGERTVARRPSVVRGESRIARPSTRRAVRGENTLARRPSARRSVRSESRVVRPSVRRAVRSENVRQSLRRSAMRTESKRIVRRPSMKREGYNLDEKTFNPVLTKFIRENYNGAKSFEVIGAKKSGSNLRLECKITMTSGKAKRTVLNCNFNPKSSIMTARDNGTFKVESKRAPFMFKISTVRNIIRCEGMKCNFITKRNTKNESKSYQVVGKYLNEKKSVRPARRISESRRTIRRPSTRRLSEAKRPARRNVASRIAESATRRSVRRPSTRRIAR